MLVGNERISFLLDKLEDCESDLNILSDIQTTTDTLVGNENYYNYISSVNHLLSTPLPTDDLEVGKERIGDMIKAVIRDAINFITELFSRIGVLIDRAANINSMMQSRILTAVADLEDDYVCDAKEYNKLNKVGKFNQKDIFLSVRRNIKLVKHNYVELDGKDMKALNAMIKNKIGLLRHTKEDADTLKYEVFQILERIRELPYPEFKVMLEKLYEKDKAVHFHIFEEPASWGIAILELKGKPKDKKSKEKDPTKDVVKSKHGEGRIRLPMESHPQTVTVSDINMLVDDFVKSIDDYNFVDIKAAFQERIRMLRKEIKDITGNKKSDVRTTKLLLGTISYLGKLSQQSVSYVHKCHTANYKALTIMIKDAGS